MHHYPSHIIRPPALAPDSPVPLASHSAGEPAGSSSNNHPQAALWVPFEGRVWVAYRRLDCWEREVPSSQQTQGAGYALSQRDGLWNLLLDAVRPGDRILVTYLTGLIERIKVCCRAFWRNERRTLVMRLWKWKW